MTLPEDPRVPSERAVRPDTSLEIRPLRPEHLQITADLHALQLPNGLFPALGKRFLSAWHRTFVDADHADAAVVVDRSADDAVVGFLLLAFDPVDHVHDVKVRHRRALVREGLLGLLRRPLVGIHFARTRARRYITRLLSRRQRDRREVAAHEQVPAVVHAVVTRPGHEGRGVARRLLDWAQDRSLDAGVEQLALVTDAEETAGGGVLTPDESGGAAAMYDRLGWRRVARHERDGRSLVEFRKDLRSEGGTTRD